MAPPPPTAPPPEPPFLQVQVDLLEEIFLRLPTAADLARASAACASFRRVIADHTFLRRYRALHPPPLIGVIGHPFVAAQPPHPSAAAARAFADFDFSCSSFLPSTAGRRWTRRGIFQGRALLAGAPIEGDRGSSILVGSEVCDFEYRDFLVRELAVCDPVHRRYVLLPAVPGDLKALIRKPDLLNLETFLAPGEDEEDPLSFRVMCLAQCRANLVLLVFSSSLGGQGQWHAHTFEQWGAQATFASFENSEPGLSNRQFVHGRFCWLLHFLHKLLVLDIRRMEFTAVDLPPEQERSGRVAIVEAAGGKLGMLTKGHADGSAYCLAYSILTDNQWHLENVIPLPIKHAYLIGVAGGYLLVEGALYATSAQENLMFGYFSVDVNTLKVELFAELSQPISSSQLYAGLPPSLCAPTI